MLIVTLLENAEVTCTVKLPESKVPSATVTAGFAAETACPLMLPLDEAQRGGGGHRKRCQAAVGVPALVGDAHPVACCAR